MAVIEQIKQHPTRVLKTIALYLNLIALGINLGMAGPTLLDLRILVQASIEEISYVLPGRAGGFAVGSFVGKFTHLQYQYMNANIVSQLVSFIQE